MSRSQPRRVCSNTALIMSLSFLSGLAPFVASAQDSRRLTRPTAQTKTPYPARVSDNRRFLLDQFGKPFFYLGDTAWELFHRLNRDEADAYLQDARSPAVQRHPGGRAGRVHGPG